jgi:hypothetical protein
MTNKTPALDKLPTHKSLMRLLQSGMTQKQIRQKYGVSKSTISRECQKALMMFGDVADKSMFRDSQFTKIQKFWSRVSICHQTGCWNWTGGTNGKYPTMGGGNGYMHRFAYETFVCEISPNMHIDHKCCNTLCVNPNHLQQVTAAVNISLVYSRRKVALEKTNEV